VKHSPPLFLFAALLAGCALSARVSHAGSPCSDDPERCVIRGASVTRSAGSVALPPAAITVAAVPAAATPALHKAVVTPAPAHKEKVAKASHSAPVQPPPATPGMGMLLKLSASSPGEVSWFPSRPADNTGASWVL